MLTVFGYELYVLLVGLSPWVSIPYSDSMGLLFPCLIAWLTFRRLRGGLGRTLLRWGLIGVCACIGYRIKPQILILLIIIIIVHCARVGLRASRTFDMLICLGVASAVAFQSIINIGMCIGITPVIGITLPFFSYGGSSMMTMFAAMGLVSGVKYKLKPKLFSLF